MVRDEAGIVTIIVWHGGRKRIFHGISEADVQMKVNGYLTRCDYQGERSFVTDSHNKTSIIV